MSGTSADGVEAVLAKFQGNPYQPRWSLLNSVSVPYPSALRQGVIDAGQGKQLSSKEWLELTEAITEVHSQAVFDCDPKGLAEMVGCHGQTVWHRPPQLKRLGASMQLLQAPLLAQLVNKAVVHDFRSADLALGGQGAPLVPIVDAAIFGKTHGWRAVLNLGGIANITLIPPFSGPDCCASVFGWDCGPANTLIDFAVQKMTNGELAFDRDGLIASNGSPNEEIIARWLKEPFFQKSPPKSTGREKFGLVDMQKRFRAAKNLSEEDFVATLTAFSAAVVAQDLDNLTSNNLVRPIELFVSGGGCRNQVMFDELVKRCRGVRVLTIEQTGIPIEAREALAFAVLAWWHSHQIQGNSPAITGAKRAVVLGSRVNPV